MDDLHMRVSALLMQLALGLFNYTGTESLDEFYFTTALQWKTEKDGTTYLLKHGFIEVARMYTNEPSEDEPEPRPFPMYRPTEEGRCISKALWQAAAGALPR